MRTGSRSGGGVRRRVWRCVAPGARPGRDKRGQRLQEQVPFPGASCSVSSHPLPSPVGSVWYVSVLTWTCWLPGLWRRHHHPSPRHCGRSQSRGHVTARAERGGGARCGPAGCLSLRKGLQAWLLDDPHCLLVKGRNGTFRSSSHLAPDR